MRNMGAVEAANAIRGRFFADRSFRGSPEEAHQIKFAKDVARELGANDTPEDVAHIVVLLREAGINLHSGDEFPKFATRKWDRTAKIVHDADEEGRWINEEKPADPDPDNLPPARTLDAPVQDLSVDLRDQVPGDLNKQGEHRPPKVPAAVTNREAAQDAYARQPAETLNRNAAAEAYDEANPGLDHDHVHDDEGTADDASHDDEPGDESVHFEEVGEADLADNADKSKGGATFAKPANTGVMAHDDPDRDGIAGQDKDPTHDSVLGTEMPKNRSGDSSAGKTDKATRPVGQAQPAPKSGKRPV